MRHPSLLMKSVMQEADAIMAVGDSVLAPIRISFANHAPLRKGKEPLASSGARCCVSCLQSNRINSFTQSLTRYALFLLPNPHHRASCAPLRAMALLPWWPTWALFSEGSLQPLPILQSKRRA